MSINRLVPSVLLMLFGIFLISGAFAQLFSHDIVIMYSCFLGGAVSLALGWYLIRRQLHL